MFDVFSYFLKSIGMVFLFFRQIYIIYEKVLQKKNVFCWPFVGKIFGRLQSEFAAISFSIFVNICLKEY